MLYDQFSSIPALFVILFFWVFEVQLLLQIVINRINVVADNRRFLRQVRFSLAGFRRSVTDDLKVRDSDIHAIKEPYDPWMPLTNDS